MPDKITPPPGYTLDSPSEATTALPPGYTLDSPAGAGAASPAQSLGQQEMSTISDLIAGAGKGAGTGLDYLSRGIDKLLPQSMRTSPERLAEQQEFLTTHNTTQKVGKGIEQAAEFMVPGAAEEQGVNAIAHAIPKIRPLAKLGASALSSGAINKMQGGSFGTGAAAGAGGALFGAGLRKIAPMLAETAMNVQGIDRAYGRTPGEAILADTRGFKPETVRRTGQETMSRLRPQVEQFADAASSRPSAPVRGMLQAPERDIPLNQPGFRGTNRGGLFDAEINPDVIEGAPAAGSFPGAKAEAGAELPTGNRRYSYGIPNPHYLSGTEHPELSGRSIPPMGVLRTRQPGAGAPPTLDEFGRVISPPEAFQRMEPPLTQPNRIASLRPARGVVNDALATTSAENAAKTHGQYGELDNFLRRRFDTGEQIPEYVTPRELLNLKRGLAKEFINRWTPEQGSDIESTAKQVYGKAADEFHRVVPEAKRLDQRMSSLAPILDRAGMASRRPGITQGVLDRFGRPTGALAPMLGGAYAGSHAYGVPGALIGGFAGAVAPHVVASPTIQMFAARGLASPALQHGVIPFIRGGALQADRHDVSTGSDQGSELTGQQRNQVMRAPENERQRMYENVVRQNRAPVTDGGRGQ